MKKRPPLYRSGVGIALFHAGGQIFMGERIDTPGAWQMPQGGIDPGEDIKTAALRELKEEIGTDKAEIIHVMEERLRYEFPPDLQRKLWRGRYAGQKQTWVAMRFTGTDADIDLAADDRPEFRAWKWVAPEDVPSQIVPFKRDVYAKVIEAFRDL